MKLLKKIELKKIKIKDLAKNAAQRPLVTFFILFFISLFLGGLIFYKENILAKKKIREGEIKPIEFDEKKHNEILKIWEEKERKFQEADFKKYPDPFNLREEQF